jgi:hypothetical protein
MGYMRPVSKNSKEGKEEEGGRERKEGEREGAKDKERERDFYIKNASAFGLAYGCF